ncbi:MAG: CAP domain-containing protein [Candidatus Nanopelagicales bacterium]
MVRRLLLLVVVLALSPWGTATTVANAGDRVRPVTARAQVSAPADSRVAQVVNRVRQRHGLRPLTVSRRMSATARPWAKHLARTTQTLAHDAGYWGDITRSCRGPRAGAENVAYRYDTPTARPVVMHRRSAVALVRMYLGSPPHRANILNPDATHLGTATAMRRSGPHQVYTANVMRFARAKSC